MTIADFIIISIISIAIGFSVYRSFKNRKSDGCSGCSQHSQPKWIKDYNRDI
ncbi:MAG TPA: FeoB-associated Cys-rich membrane protein [Erysipelothrix sp.]|jgi:hypothetical protein|nr:FeoB-associated Cys-rich membrane protein [Erysipelothrix sp.]